MRTLGSLNPHKFQQNLNQKLQAVVQHAVSRNNLGQLLPGSAATAANNFAPQYTFPKIFVRR
jgi:hypothetical protein